MSNSDLLKEAIADAKAVRETALANAKMALEEAFTPQLKSMLSAKLKEEEDDDEAEEGRMSDDADDDEAEEGRMSKDEAEDDDEAEEGRMSDDEEGGEGVPAEEAEEEPADEGDDADEDEMDENSLDLEAVIKELESELSEEEETEEGEEVEEEYEVDEAIFTEDDDDDDDDDAVEEQSKSSGIGAGDNKVSYASASDEEDPQGAKVVKVKMEAVEAELAEYKEAVHYLKDKLHEVNILNAKLLFTNKLFKEFSLNNNQKLKVVETFDRAQTTREIKLVYSTLAEQFGDNASIVTKKSISESASSAVASTKPSKESRKVISEETQVADRFRKLAGIIK